MKIFLFIIRRNNYLIVLLLTDLFLTKYWQNMYSVMQSDGNSFCQDVVLGSINMASCYEDSILYQIYEIKIFTDIYYENIYIICHVNAIQDDIKN